MTLWMIWPQPGHGERNLCNFLAQEKQVIRCAVRPWMMFPLRGRTWHRLQGSRMASDVSFIPCPKSSRSRLSPWELSSPSETHEGVSRAAFRVRALLGGSGLSERWEGRMTGSDTVLRQSGISIPSSCSASCPTTLAGMSGTEMECTSRGQSLYQSLRRAQQRMQ